jgi:hypothetical protein
MAKSAEMPQDRSNIFGHSSSEQLTATNAKALFRIPHQMANGFCSIHAFKSPH